MRNLSMMIYTSYPHACFLRYKLTNIYIWISGLLTLVGYNTRDGDFFTFSYPSLSTAGPWMTSFMPMGPFGNHCSVAIFKLFLIK